MPIFKRPTSEKEWCLLCTSRDRNAIFHLKDILDLRSLPSVGRTRKDKVYSLWVPRQFKADAILCAEEVAESGLFSIEVDREGLDRPLVVDPASIREAIDEIDAQAAGLRLRLEVATHMEAAAIANKTEIPLKESFTLQEYILLCVEAVCMSCIIAIPVCLFGTQIAIALIANIENIEEANRMDRAFVFPAVICVLVILFLSYVSRVARKARRRREQSRRTSFAERLWMLLQEGCHVPPFAFYLRPFEADHSFFDRARPVKRSIDWLFILWRLYVPWTFFPERFVAVEFRLAQALWRRQPMVALGSYDDRPGPGLISVHDTEWTRAFVKLAASATTLILLPGTSRGSIAEMSWLKKSEMLSKGCRL